MTILDAHGASITPMEGGRLLTFLGVEGYDVYNASLPFTYAGNTYLFGRVEKREIWADSTARLFIKQQENQYALVPDAKVYPLEDPFLVPIDDEFVLGGTCVTKTEGVVTNYHVRFYRGKNPLEMECFATGPERMKDIRLVELPNGEIGVMSRHRGTEITREKGSLAEIGYTQIKSLDRLCPEIIANAPLIPSVFTSTQWGGANQLIPLEGGRIGVVGHHAWQVPFEGERPLAIYVATSFRFDPKAWQVEDLKLIGKRRMFPDYPPKRPFLQDCLFTSGIVTEKGQTLLYSGLGDAAQGYLPIVNPFA